ncbi:MAG: hypothetical protein L6R38_009203 [Xanthoria sp. 2 TBL-2021]|nr:MAG: hypothetical protein L6R38_009203 [Xanthoria sp. 2 TBL-2021]
MAKLKPSRKDQSARQKRGNRKDLDRVLPDRPTHRTTPKESADELAAKASALLQTSQADEALPIALKALKQLKKEDDGLRTNSLPTLNLLAEINLELGNVDEAREYFSHAFQLDPDGLIPESQGGGVEKFLWLAQLSEDGGNDSVAWFQKAITVLRIEISSTSESALKVQRNRKLAAALCSVIEIYMTDLSWEPDAESRCESLITEAILIAPESPETLQTLANVRISQERIDEAKKALADSMALWKELPSGDEGAPDFPTRISLARLLMEVGMEKDAMEVLERLTEEDDTSVEAWYLGGWCAYLTAERSQSVSKSATNGSGTKVAQDSEYEASLMSSRDWLQNSLRLYESQDYEDLRLRDHAAELIHDLDAQLGGTNEEEEEEEEDAAEDDNWESDLEDEDQEMT